jgi:hypothetical protein
MPARIRPPVPLDAASFQGVEAVFTDVDGTLTTHERLESATLRAIEELQAGGVRVVLVSGRPAGWGECWMRQLPVDGVIVENGGLWYARDPAGALRKRYIQIESVRARNRARLVKEVAAAMRKVPGARLSSDSAHTEVDLAIDYNEEVQLGHAAADVLEKTLRAKGIQAVRSSVHVNCWIGAFDKLAAVKRFLADEWGTTLRADDPRFAYVGDSFNDAPMFAGFGLSVGVANVRKVLDTIEHAPKWVTRSAEGKGFRELARVILRGRSARVAVSTSAAARRARRP